MNDPQISAEDKARYMQVMADYDEAMRQVAIEIRQRKAADHFTTCRDCGRFADKSRWVPRDSVHAQRGARPLCAACFHEYDYDY